MFSSTVFKMFSRTETVSYISKKFSQNTVELPRTNTSVKRTPRYNRQQGRNQLIFSGGGKMILTCCCTIFGRKWLQLVVEPYQLNVILEILGEGNGPVAQPLVAGLTGSFSQYRMNSAAFMRNFSKAGTLIFEIETTIWASKEEFFLGNRPRLKTTTIFQSNTKSYGILYSM